MRYLSICSGIEAASVAWEPLGWECAGVSEIMPFPSAVLAHHYPNVRNFGDFTNIQREDFDGPVDLLVGGTPCQSFSVAGLRRGLDDDRGNLALEFLRLADRLSPTWIVFENVPGLLSQDGGRAFGAFLGGLVELGYGFAYRVMDAQYVRVESHPRAVPQRRRRVFVVGCAGGDWQRAAAVLLERESLRGHPAPRRESGTGVAGTLEARAGTGGYDCGASGAASGHLIPEVALQSVNCPRERKQNGIGISDEGAMYSLTTRDLHGVMVPLPHQQDQIVTPDQASPCLSAGHTPRGHGGHHQPLVAVAFSENQRGEVVTSDVAHALSTGGGKPGSGYGAVAVALRGREDGADIEVGDDCSFALRASQGGGDKMLVMAQGCANAEITEGFSPTLTTVHDGPPIVMAPAFSKRPGQQIATKDDGGCFALTTGEPPRLATPGYAVRRLTPTECEKLQGFEPGWTDVPWRGKAHAPDGPRYHAIGNSMAVNVMSWIGERIEAAAS